MQVLICIKSSLRWRATGDTKVHDVGKNAEWILAKGLEHGTYRWPKPADAKNGKLSLEPGALAMLTDGIDLRDLGLAKMLLHGHWTSVRRAPGKPMRRRSDIAPSVKITN